MAEVDDRRGTIELQTKDGIALCSDNVLAVALPRSFLQDQKCREVVIHKWLAKPIPYDIYIDRPASDAREILSRVHDFLSDEGYWHE